LAAGFDFGKSAMRFVMKESEVRSRAYAMPLTSPAYPVGPYRFCNREYLIITYRTDPKKLRELVPEPLQIEGDVVKFEFIRMPDSTGFGDYTESGQVIPVSFQGRKGGYTHCMFLNDHPPIAGGRELWGFPKKLAQPTLKTEIDTLIAAQVPPWDPVNEPQFIILATDGAPNDICTAFLAGIIVAFAERYPQVSLDFTLSNQHTNLVSNAITYRSPDRKSVIALVLSTTDTDAVLVIESENFLWIHIRLESECAIGNL